MRRNFIFSLLLLFVMTGYARQISDSEAADVATAFFKASGVDVQSRMKPLKFKGQKAESKSLPYYVYNAGNDNGFVIISGDDRMKKVLGYSDRGRLDAENLPPQLEDLLGQYTGFYNALPAEMTQHPSWKSNARANDVVLMETAKWNQYAPFNLMAPEFDGERGPIGCVATALAIIMDYQKFPTKAAKPIKHEWYSSGTLYSYDFGNMNIDYSLLKDEYLPEDQLTPAEEKAISELLYAAAATVNMQFGPFSSGAGDRNKQHMYRNVLGMSSDCQFVARTYFNDDQWNELIREQLDNQMPIMYSARSDFDGHAFVLDGYDSEGNYHVNWGWGGYENGYFSIDGLLDFTKNHGMTINMKPSDNYEEESKRYSSLWMDGGTSAMMEGWGKSAGLSLTVSDIKKDEPFTAMAGLFFAWKKFYGDCTLALVDADGNIVEISHVDPQYFQAEMDYYWLKNGSDVIQFGTNRWDNVYFESEIKDDYRIAVVAKEDGEDEWKLVHGTLDAPSSLPVKGNTAANVEVNFHVTGDPDKVNYYVDDRAFMYGDSYPLNVDVVDGVVAVYVNGVLCHHATSYRPLRQWILIGRDKYDVELRYISREDLIERSYVVSEPGTLSSMIADEDRDRIGTIKISGNINVADIEAVGDLIYLMNIDLEDALFVEEGKNKENFIPEFALYVYSREFIPPYETIKFPKNLKGFQQISINHYNMDVLDIPASVDTYGYGCLNSSPWGTSLKFVNVRNPIPGNLEEGLIRPFTNSLEQVLFVPEGSKEAYENDPDWNSMFSEIIEVTEDAPFIGEYVEDENARYIVLTDFAALVGFKGYKEADKIKDTVEYNGKEYPVKCVIPNKLNSPKNLIANTEEEFDWNQTLPNTLYSPFLTNKAKNINENTEFYIPGAAKSRSDYYDIEMYSYEINKSNGELRIVPILETVKIDGVTINGERKESGVDGLYYFDPSVCPNVKVDYTLFDEFPMSTYYNQEFNAVLPDSELTGIEKISDIDASENVKVFDIQGVMVYEGNLENAALPQGVYVIVQGRVSKAVILNK